MVSKANSYLADLKRIMDGIVATDEHGNVLCFSDGTESAIEIIRTQTYSGYKIIFIGNGGSAAISSHMAVDY